MTHKPVTLDLAIPAIAAEDRIWLPRIIALTATVALVAALAQTVARLWA